MHSNIDLAKRVLLADTQIRTVGIFGAIAYSGYFPPRPFLNEFLMEGHDLCDQDERMESWKPFSLTAEEYCAVKAWWQSIHPDSVEDALESTCWHDWAVEVIDRRY
jgi:hypothetical protein